VQLLVNRDGRHLGPYSIDQACQLLAEGKLHSWDLCWPDGGGKWVTLDSIEGVADKAFALREQRRAESIAKAQSVSSTDPNSPTPQFVAPQPGESTQITQSQGVNWMRPAIWLAFAGVIAISVFVWANFTGDNTLIQNLERRTDNMTYERGSNTPFNGTAYSYFVDDTLWEKVDYVNGIREGARTVWHINGNVALQEDYSNGFLQSSASFDFNGARTDNFENGSGTIILYWNDTGIRSQKLVYKNRIIVKRTIWDREGLLLSVIPPELPPNIAINPVLPTITNSVLPTITNSVLPTITNSVLPTNQVITITNKPTIDTTPNPEIFGRTRVWVMGDPNVSSSRVAIDKRIDLIYINKPTNVLIKVFGYPDQASTNWWSYGDMKVKNIQAGGYFKNVHFQVYNGRVYRVIGAP
jgi:hypothetical protein